MLQRTASRFVMAIVAGAFVAGYSGAQPATNPYQKERVTYKSGSLTLVGFVYRPAGAGRFPTVIWNHGSEKGPGEGPQFDSVAAVFVPAGYAVFAPTRRGHGKSEGVYIVDTLNRLRASGNMNGANELMVHLLTTEQLDDQFAGVSYARKLPFVDTTQMVVAGCSFGGIQTLLAAEHKELFKAAFPISPAAQTWDGNAAVRARMLAAVKKIEIPVFLVQPPRDASMAPEKDMREAANAAGKKQFRTKVYAAVMPDSQQTHCFGGAKGFHNWAADAVAFFDGVLKRKR